MTRKTSSSAPRNDTKTCASCGRSITWRKKWERSWNEVRFCSNNCRQNNDLRQNQALEQTILSLLEKRGKDKSICPSEAAKTLVGNDPAQWKPLMNSARSAARRLVAQGRIVITQQGHIVDSSTAKGPIRLRLP